MKVEVVNCSIDVVDDTDVAFWVATVIEIKHYRVQLRYEGYESNPAGDFWFDLRSRNIHPVGWCAKRNKLLIPPPGMILIVVDSAIANYLSWRGILHKEMLSLGRCPILRKVSILERCLSCRVSLVENCLL